MEYNVNSVNIFGYFCTICPTYDMQSFIYFLLYQSKNSFSKQPMSNPLFLSNFKLIFKKTNVLYY